jgi:hypothetical protein
MHYSVDQSQVQRIAVQGSDQDGQTADIDAVVIPVLIPVSEVATLLAAFDEADPLSPGDELSRDIVRAVLKSLKVYNEQT